MPRALRYGPGPSQAGDLYLPPEPDPRVVCLLHGGFWRMPYGKDQMSSIAHDLCGRGFAVWNIEYRRIGEPRVGWPEISSDIPAALAFLQSFSEQENRLDLQNVVLVGHSAGGQLALACTSQQAQTLGLPVRPAAVVALAALTDLEETFASEIGGGVVRALLGGAPAEVPDRYASASPIRLLPHGTKQLLIHGGRDEAVPVSLSRSYTRKARLAGDDVSYVELAETGHMDYLDPRSAAHKTLCDWLQGDGS